MRSVTLDRETTQRIIDAFAKGGGRYVEVPVVVGWPELRLTDEQMWQNAIARAYGFAPPYVDNTFFSVRLEMPL